LIHNGRNALPKLYRAVAWISHEIGTMMLMKWSPLAMMPAAALTGIVSRKELLAMSRAIESDPGTTCTGVDVMEGGELARNLERVFQIFCHAQEDWAMKHDSGQPADGMEKDADCPA